MVDAIVGGVIMVVATTSLFLAIEVAEKAERTREKDAKRKKRFRDKQRAARKAREHGG